MYPEYTLMTRHLKDSYIWTVFFGKIVVKQIEILNAVKHAVYEQEGYAVFYTLELKRLTSIKISKRS